MAQRGKGLLRVGPCLASLVVLYVLAASRAAASPVAAYEDAQGGWLVTDGAPHPGALWLFSIGETAALTMPPAGSVAACDDRALAWSGEIAAAAAATGLDAALIGAVVWAESRCNPRARSPKGAMGLMQLMPATARAYGVADAYDPAQNLQGGSRYLRDLLAMFNGDVELALAAYNAGPRSVVAARMAIPPYRETRAYVPAVLSRWRARSAG